MSRRGLALALLGGAMLVALNIRPKLDPDMFWQVATGELILRRGAPPPRDLFTYTCAGRPVPPVYWLSQAVYALAYRWGSWEAVELIHEALLVAALLIAATSVRRDEATTPCVVAAAWLGFVVVHLFRDIRPQDFALCGFAALLALARSRLRPAALLAGTVPVLLIWQNAHPSVLLGVIVVGALAAADRLGWLRDRARPRPWWVLSLALLAGAGLLATPIGAGIVAVYRTWSSPATGCSSASGCRSGGWGRVGSRCS